MTMMNWFEETPIISPVYFGDAYTDSEAKRELCRMHLAKFVRENRHARGCIEALHFAVTAITLLFGGPTAHTKAPGQRLPSLQCRAVVTPRGRT